MRILRVYQLAKCSRLYVTNAIRLYTIILYQSSAQTHGPLYYSPTFLLTCLYNHSWQFTITSRENLYEITLHLQQEFCEAHIPRA